jgi:tRNA pseudouridine55 synthase
MSEHNIPRKRDVHGILLLEKPSGITSNAALQQVKRLFCAKKAGHTGSLDPLANGMLPICFGEATKFSQYLLDADKIYVVKAKLGVRTASGDSEGEVIAERALPEFTRQQLEKMLEKFRGDIEQIPSMYSALKYQGQPLYKLARQGIEIPRQPRPVKIYEIEMRAWQQDIIEVYVHCSKGTYVRTLIDDFGEALGCGAHVIALRRLSVGHYPEEKMISLTELEKISQAETPAALDRYLLSIESIMGHFPVIKTSKLITLYFRQGQAVMVPHAPTRGYVRMFADDGEFIGIGEIQSDGKIAPRRLIQHA